MLESPRRPPVDFSFFSSGAGLAIVSQDNAVCLFEVESGDLLVSLWGGKDEKFVSVFFPDEESSVAALLADGRIRLWSAS
jgi:WD40 repeat protein